MNILFENKTFTISDDVWEKYKEMHPVRTEEVILRDIRVALTTNFNEKNIENMIMEEYNLQKNFAKVLIKAEKKYKKEKCNVIFSS